VTCLCLLLAGPNGSRLALAAPGAGSPLPPEQLRQKYGLFVHYVWGGADKTITVNRDGSKPASLQEVADRFDAAGFARDVQSMGVEYVIFTAWHANMNLLYPCASMDRWITKPHHTANRDVIQALLDELQPKGIMLYLYMHPQDGHDFTASEQAATGFNDPTNNYQTWNNFINDVYGESVARYGTNVAGYWIDCCTVKSNNHANIVDFDRLRATIQANNPKGVIIETSHYAALWGMYFGHILSKEINDPGWFDFQPVTWDVNSWPGYDYHVAIVEAPTWFASTSVTSTNGVKKTPEEMFRFTVFQAGVNTRGMGVAWAAGPYPGGGWEPQVKESLQALGRLIAPIAKSVKGVYASTSYPTAPGTRMRDLAWGVATCSTDDQYEYIHVLKAPASRTLDLPPPHDGKRFKAARLLKNGREVKLAQNAQTGALSLTLPPEVNWEPLDTVIRLQSGRKAPGQKWPEETLMLKKSKKLSLSSMAFQRPFWS
jgi:alpha-L-fucosidase